MNKLNVQYVVADAQLVDGDHGQRGFGHRRKYPSNGMVGALSP